MLLYLFQGLVGACAYLCYERSGIWENYESYCEIERSVQSDIKMMNIHVILHKGCLVLQSIRMLSIVHQICRLYIYGREGVMDAGIQTVHTGHPKRLQHDNRTIDPEYLKFHVLNNDNHNYGIVNLTFDYQEVDSPLRCMYVEYSCADSFRPYYAFLIKLQYVELPFYNFSLDNKQREYKGSMKMFLGLIKKDSNGSVIPITIAIAAKHVSDEIRLRKRGVFSLMSFKVYYGQKNCSLEAPDTIIEFLTRKVDYSTRSMTDIQLRFRLNISTELLFFETTYNDITFLPSTIPRCHIFIEYRMTVLVKLAHPQSISCYKSHQTAIQVRGYKHIAVIYNIAMGAKVGGGGLWG